MRLRRACCHPRLVLPDAAVGGAKLAEGWLVIFDLRAGTSWEERITSRAVTHEGRTIHIVGC